MARYKVEYEEDNIVYNLTFRGVVFQYDINNSKYCLARQLSDYFDDITFEQIDGLYENMKELDEESIVKGLEELE